jgi:uncharacterized cupredoxin-like copper-binding protein
MYSMHVAGGEVMRNKNLTTVLAALVIMLILSGCGGGSSAENALKGTWKVVSITEDTEVTANNSMVGIKAMLVKFAYKEGTTIVFKDKNKVDLVSYNISSEYKIEENKLLFKDAQTGEWSPDYFEYEINSDKMTWKMSGITLNLEKQK